MVTITGARRTPIGTAGHAFRDVDAAQLAAPVLAALAAESVDEIVLGNCTGPGGDVARVAALTAGFDLAVPALTVDQQCASGLAAIVAAADRVAARGGRVIAGGVESASTAPQRAWRDGTPFSRAPFAPASIGDPEMGLAADLLAEEAGIGRAAQDAYAARSHERAWAAAQAGRFAAEIVPVAGIAIDERPRDGLTAERLARLRPAWRPDGTVTAGNSCGINDGAAAVSISAEDVAGLRVLATATVGVDPNRPGRAIVPAVRRALESAGLDIDQMDVIEFNEAFAGQMLACAAELELDPERICPEGGALALGHPWGASGAVLVVRLFHQLLGGSGRYGLAAIAAGGGQGVAIVVEACR